MNRRARPPAAPTRAGVAALALAASLAGCADIHRAMETPRINPESPVAPAVAAGADRNYPYPLLRDVPPVPKNLPIASDVKTQVGGLVTCRRAMASYVVDHPPLSGQPATFATDARAVANITAADVAPPDSAAKADAFAAQLRAQAAPPAPIGSGPPPTPQEAMPPVAPAPVPAGAHKAHAAAKGHPPARPSPAPAATSPAASAPAAAAPAAAPTAAVPTVETVPSLPPPLADPLLARCS